MGYTYVLYCTSAAEIVDKLWKALQKLANYKAAFQLPTDADWLFNSTSIIYECI